MDDVRSPARAGTPYGGRGDRGVSEDLLLDLDALRDAAIAAQTGGPPLVAEYPESALLTQLREAEGEVFE